MFDWYNIGALIVILLISIMWHELAHVLMAGYLGDDTPRRSGHLSLNPFSHMDQFGIILLFLSVFSSQGTSGFAYGFTPVNERNMRPNPKVGGGIVAIVGPLSNLLLAALLAIPFRLHDPYTIDGLLQTSRLYMFLLQALTINVLLAVFNVIPLPPLDGWRVLETFLSPRTLFSLRGVKQYGPLILVALFLLGGKIGFFTFLYGTFIDPISHFLMGV